MNIEFKPCSTEEKPDGLGLDDADGAYLTEGRHEYAGQWQVTVLGSPQGSPGDYADALENYLNRPIEIVQVFVLPPASNATDKAQAIWRRGFLGIRVQPAAGT
jgi:hypothetical protein